MARNPRQSVSQEQIGNVANALDVGAWVKPSLIVGRLLDVIDDEDFDGASRRFQLEPELFL